jgi:hypothetical protein
LYSNTYVLRKALVELVVVKLSRSILVLYFSLLTQVLYLDLTLLTFYLRVRTLP